jgi:CheY-like chemotaxis protein
MACSPVRVLLIDDSVDDAILIERAIRRAGIELTIDRVATRPDLSAALADEHGWDVVLCDHIMPTLDAAEVLAWVHSAIPAVPILIVCGLYPQPLWHELGSGIATRIVTKDRLSDLAPAILAAVARSASRTTRRALQDATTPP